MDYCPWLTRGREGYYCNLYAENGEIQCRPLRYSAKEPLEPPFKAPQWCPLRKQSMLVFFDTESPWEEDDCSYPEGASQ